MYAHNRFLPDWFTMVRTRQITLPRFQRFVAWGPNEVAGLLTTVLRGLPSGAALILQVGDKELFNSRTIVDAPETGGRVIEQLLDGQQRITALWRALYDKYPDKTYLVGFEDDAEKPDEKKPFVYGQSRWKKGAKRFPVWVDNPSDCWNKKFIPVRLLCTEDLAPEIEEWSESAVADIADEKEKYKEAKKINKVINNLRTKVREFNLPYLALPSSTSKDVALDVFVKMNTSSVKLSAYDIIVALVEEETGNSLHEHVRNLVAQVPRIIDYVDSSELILDVVALRQDRIPSQAGYKNIDYVAMLADWTNLTESVRGLVTFLEDECIFDGQRLPSYTPLPVIAALWNVLPTQPDKLGNARHLLKKYLWRSFITSRYEQSSSSNALQDYRKLRESIINETATCDAPIFSFDLPSVEHLMTAGWPKGKTILGRGVLALSLKAGADDVADGMRASVASITSRQNPREYHHLFPASMLEKAGLSNDQIYKALNCALITWRTNRVISDKDPISYLEDRSANGVLGTDELTRRLKTHLIPTAELSVGYDKLSGEAKSDRTKSDYEVFLRARAEIISKAIVEVCEGRVIDLNTLFAAPGAIQAA